MMLPLLLLDDDDKNKTSDNTNMLIMMMMSGGNMGDMNNILPLLLLDDDSVDFKNFFLYSNMLKQGKNSSEHYKFLFWLEKRFSVQIISFGQKTDF